MPHYPDEVEYSDKYQDEHYEYRHVILPKDVYRKMPRHRILNENVDIYWLRNGVLLECSSPEAGSTMNYTVQNLTSFSSADQEEPTLKLAFPLLVSSLLLIPMPTDAFIS